ncbi:hypothetical protein PILCRDRAFT_10963 [Piloderma croceum F 1598]|uniref:Uncharacterized protein n=1 Tax=Piloderma croceum (strain F 1598) TaxID=765440 RepID=A0A0C3F1U7_PILCF|nr:hypothetical protein PILCRDRAFT_10963 [Piloderma croceum F 1598]
MPTRSTTPTPAFALCKGKTRSADRFGVPTRVVESERKRRKRRKKQREEEKRERGQEQQGRTPVSPPPRLCHSPWSANRMPPAARALINNEDELVVACLQRVRARTLTPTCPQPRSATTTMFMTLSHRSRPHTHTRMCTCTCIHTHTNPTPFPASTPLRPCYLKSTNCHVIENHVTNERHSCSRCRTMLAKCCA